MPTEVTRKRRTDAEHNRQHIVAVARAGFAEDGLDLPMREIARRAGIGVATLYRHFPARPDLVSAVLAEQVRSCAETMRAIQADPDPWRALSRTIHHFGEQQIQNRGLNEALFGSHDAGTAFADQRREHAAALAHLVERARTTGAVRQDLSVEDVRVGMMAIAAFHALPAAQAKAAISRLTNLVLAGLKPGPVAPATREGQERSDRS